MIEIETFGIKHGYSKNEYNVLLDVRFLDNPFYIKELKELTGLNDDVYNFVINQIKCKELLMNTLSIINNYTKDIKVGIYCTGGQHRSVSVGRYLSNKLNCKIHHRDIEVDEIEK